MKTEHYVATVDEIPEGARRIVTVAGREIGVFNVKVSYHALRNLCFHQIGPLCEGSVNGTFVAGPETNWKPRWEHDGEILYCPWHYMEFNILTGQCLAFPKHRVRKYEVQVKEEKIYLIV